MSQDSSIARAHETCVEDLTGTSGDHHLECEAKVGRDSRVVEDSWYLVTHFIAFKMDSFRSTSKMA